MMGNNEFQYEITDQDVIEAAKNLGFPLSEITSDVIRQVKDNVNSLPDFQQDYRVYLLRNALVSGKNN